MKDSALWLVRSPVNQTPGEGWIATLYLTIASIFLNCDFISHNSDFVSLNCVYCTFFVAATFIYYNCMHFFITATLSIYLKIATLNLNKCICFYNCNFTITTLYLTILSCPPIMSFSYFWFYISHLHLFCICISQI